MLKDQTLGFWPYLASSRSVTVEVRGWLVHADLSLLGTVPSEPAHLLLVDELCYR